ncbi:MAG: hypothetical protein COV30_00055 [Candidatus Yanofskybacteria bacterium CG10_big_fil_rev_8_21_14_0_10_37_15]|uniref:Uncharacterized protein n=1 Tax=Candidatus Yanofskybacteria bacterium CG10_big_fil_rev_8_21_14_0_10_37_15 TaxID=1975097 RepID=A0A2H0R6L2_9BACT|nr:MAG: hypothetical protein COV30_00055 [Candidatus Yanofskybacteria bacterium CG10_big_fil_rev_8_21_14_0_10_37_15]
MKINVKVKPNFSEERVEKISDTEFIVCVKEPPVQGRANRAVVRALSEYFHTSRVRIVSGHISRQKIVEVL